MFFQFMLGATSISFIRSMYIYFILELPKIVIFFITAFSNLKHISKDNFPIFYLFFSMAVFFFMYFYLFQWNSKCGWNFSLMQLSLENICEISDWNVQYYPSKVPAFFLYKTANLINISFILQVEKHSRSRHGCSYWFKIHVK